MARNPLARETLFTRAANTHFHHTVNASKQSKSRLNHQYLLRSDLSHPESSRHSSSVSTNNKESKSQQSCASSRLTVESLNKRAHSSQTLSASLKEKDIVPAKNSLVTCIEHPG